VRRISSGRSADLSHRRAGVLEGDKILAGIACDEIGDLIQKKTVSGGMVLKLEAAKRALEGGVSGVHIVGGTIPDGLLRAVRAAEFKKRPLALTRFQAHASFVNPSRSALPWPFRQPNA